MSYLEKRIPEFQKKTQAALQAGKRDLMKLWKARWLAASTRKNQLEAAVGSGQLTQEDYKGIIERQKAKDEALLAYLQSSGGDAARIAIVMERIQTIEEEIQQF